MANHELKELFCQKGTIMFCQKNLNTHKVCREPVTLPAQRSCCTPGIGEDDDRQPRWGTSWAKVINGFFLTV